MVLEGRSLPIQVENGDEDRMTDQTKTKKNRLDSRCSSVRRMLISPASIWSAFSPRRALVMTLIATGSFVTRFTPLYTCRPQKRTDGRAEHNERHQTFCQRHAFRFGCIFYSAGIRSTLRARRAWTRGPFSSLLSHSPAVPVEDREAMTP